MNGGTVIFSPVSRVVRVGSAVADGGVRTLEIATLETQQLPFQVDGLAGNPGTPASPEQAPGALEVAIAARGLDGQEQRLGVIGPDAQTACQVLACLREVSFGNGTLGCAEMTARPGVATHLEAPEADGQEQEQDQQHPPSPIAHGHEALQPIGR
jgi:hypothetical protein